MTKQRANTLILLPAHNESGRIGNVIQGVRETGLHADILVVDDGSSDTTPADAKARGAKVV